jgi:hypothetical protein
MDSLRSSEPTFISLSYLKLSQEKKNHAEVLIITVEVVMETTVEAVMEITEAAEEAVGKK